MDANRTSPQTSTKCQRRYRSDRNALTQAARYLASALVLVSLFALATTASSIKQQWRPDTQHNQYQFVPTSEVADQRQSQSDRLALEALANTYYDANQQNGDNELLPSRDNYRSQGYSNSIDELRRFMTDEPSVDDSRRRQQQYLSQFALQNSVENSEPTSDSNVYVVDNSDAKSSISDAEQRKFSDKLEALIRRELSLASDSVERVKDNNYNDDEKFDVDQSKWNTKATTIVSPYIIEAARDRLQTQSNDADNSNDEKFSYGTVQTQPGRNQDNGDTATDELVANSVMKRDSDDGLFTTLLEDEIDQNKTKNLLTTISSTPAGSEPIKTLHQDQVVSGSSQSSNAENESIFTRIYNGITYYLPSFKSMNIFGAKNNSNNDSRASSVTVTKLSNDDDAQENSVSNESLQKEDNSAEIPKNDHVNAKQSVSDNTIDTDDSMPASSEQGTNDKNEDKDAGANLNKAISGQMQQQQANTYDNSPGLELQKSSDSDSKTGNGANANLVNRIPDKRISASDDQQIDLGETTPERNIGEDLVGKVNLMRQSNLVLPLSSSDDDVLARTSKNSESSASKYIYAPTQHYYINTNGPDGGALSEFDQRNYDNVDHVHSTRSLTPFGAMNHRGAAKFQPGDRIYNAFEPQTGYMHQKDNTMSLLADANKANDVYFLVMVGAFCMMAMAVVFSAGLFAYRVQQNRKSTQEADYPTYGVVGPNNMNAKCGAAAFIGGYLGNGGGPSGTGPVGGATLFGVTGNKSASTRNVSELHASGSDSGLDNKSLSKKASVSSSVDLQKQQQQAGTRVSPVNTAANQDAARMYHYQHQKQQMIILDRSATGGRHTSASDLDSEDENEDGSYTVYECPGLASAHEMEIKNPLFNDDRTP